MASLGLQAHRYPHLHHGLDEGQAVGQVATGKGVNVVAENYGVFVLEEVPFEGIGPIAIPEHSQSLFWVGFANGLVQVRKAKGHEWLHTFRDRLRGKQAFSKNPP